MKKRWKELNVHADYELYANFQRNNLRYYMCRKGDMKSNRKYISKKEVSLRKELQERFYLERAIALCQQNIEMLDLVKDSYNSIDPIDVVRNASLAYQEQENATRLVYGYEKETMWKKKKLAWKAKFKVPNPEKLRHIAGDGTATRSKSEALIIDLLNMKGIPYVYDYPMKLYSKLKWPDFIIWDKKHNRELVIEHLGMMYDQEYRENQTEKLGLYILEGYVPNVNLLLTFDDKDGIINVPAISRMIDAFMCI
ncbi:MAG: hypothetical protein KBS56_06090 [Clostridiales bacterium]|nr:hypothetical protein [Candidatus Crickella equi]